MFRKNTGLIIWLQEFTEKTQDCYSPVCGVPTLSSLSQFKLWSLYSLCLN
ncbi:hypothetical protein Hanom_Chr16g01476841 [Helianthus anomalus]